MRVWPRQRRARTAVERLLLLLHRPADEVRLHTHRRRKTPGAGAAHHEPVAQRWLRLRPRLTATYVRIGGGSGDGDLARVAATPAMPSALCWAAART